MLVAETSARHGRGNTPATDRRGDVWAFAPGRKDGRPAAPAPPTWRRRALAAAPLFATLCLAAGLRTAWLMLVHPNPNDGRFDDTVWYWNTARFIAAGDGFRDPYRGSPTLAWPPGYSAFLGAIFKAFGEGRTQAYAANVVLALITITAVYAAARMLLGSRTAIVAALLLAAWPGQIEFTSLALSEPLFAALFALGLLLVLWLPRCRARSWPVLLLLAAVVAAAALTRGQGLALVPIACLWWLLCRPGARRWATWSLGLFALTAVMLVPWTVRNERLSGSFVLIASNFGSDFWIGNHAGASGRMATEQPVPRSEATSRTVAQNEAASSRIAVDDALAYARSHPAAETRLALTKLRALYESDATAIDWNAAYGDHRNFSSRGDAWLRGSANAFWFDVLALAGIGIAAGARRYPREIVLFVAVILSWTAGHVLFFGDPRFHYPLAVVIAPLAALGIVWMWEMAASTRAPTPSRSHATDPTRTLAVTAVPSRKR